MTVPGNVNLAAEVMYGKTLQSIFLRPRINAVKVTASAATVNIRKPGGAATSITAGVCTVDSDGSIRYALDASDSTIWTLGSNYWADFTFTANAVVEYVRTTFDVVLQPLLRHCPIDADDIKGADPRITAYLANNARMTADLPQYILSAWEDVYLWVRSREMPRPYLISDARVLYAVTRYRALFWICGAIAENNPHFKEMADVFLANFESAKMLTQFEYAPEGTRSVDVRRAVQQPELTTGPDRSRAGSVLDEDFWARVAGIRR